MIYVYSGSCTQIIGDNSITMNKGDLCILDTNTYHTISPIGNNDIVINCLIKKSYFDATFLSRLSGNDILARFFVRSIYQSKDFNDYILFMYDEEINVNEIIENMLCEYHDKKTCFSEVINSYLVILFSELLRSYNKCINHKNYKALYNNKISDIIMYIQKNYMSCTIVSTAKHFNFHPVYLSKILKKLPIATFMDLKNEARLRKARLLLENTSYKVDAIARDIGYSNISFFYKIFKEKYKMTPSEYRKSRYKELSSK